MAEERAEWDGGEVERLWDDEEPRRPARRRLVVALAVVPWILVAFGSLGLLDGAPPGSEPGPARQLTDSESATRAEPGSSATPGATTSATAPSEADTTSTNGAGELPATRLATLGSGARIAVTARDAEALTLPVVRAWISSRPGAGSPARYLEHLAVEAVDFPAPGALVVTAIAVVLTAEGDQWGEAEVWRIAVPFTLVSRTIAPGSPYLLAPPAISAASVGWTPVSDHELEADAAQALVEAGYRSVALSSLAESDGWPWLATATAIAPGSTDVETHEIWLRVHLGRFVVAGWLPTAPPT